MTKNIPIRLGRFVWLGEVIDSQLFKHFMSIGALFFYFLSTALLRMICTVSVFFRCCRVYEVLNGNVDIMLKFEYFVYNIKLRKNINLWKQCLMSILDYKEPLIATPAFLAQWSLLCGVEHCHAVQMIFPFLAAYCRVRPSTVYP